MRQTEKRAFPPLNPPSRLKAIAAGFFVSFAFSGMPHPVMILGRVEVPSRERPPRNPLYHSLPGTPGINATNVALCP